jgi:hypothetical protein
MLLRLWSQCSVDTREVRRRRLGIGVCLTSAFCAPRFTDGGLIQVTCTHLQKMSTFAEAKTSSPR